MLRELVAYAKWQCPHTLTSEQRARKDAAEEERNEPLPEGTKLELRAKYYEAILDRRRNHCDETQDYSKPCLLVICYILTTFNLVLHFLAVSPNHQRKGLGVLLIREGLTIADQHNANTYVEASPEGLQLYQRHGWKEVDEIRVDLKPYGWNEISVDKCMIRKHRISSGLVADART